MRRPWAAADVADFWRRWHATLSAWWRDYVYVSLGGARAAARNVVLVFLASALWHGWALSKTFGWMGFPPRAWQGVLVCALLNAAGVIAAHALAGRLGRGGGALPSAVRTLWAGLFTWLFVALAWLPMLMLPTTSLADLGAIYLRLIGLR
jgi:D-alanyl-lipoteichoic acid acyltransferase DltB (MBOAT superfamily)